MSNKQSVLFCSERIIQCKSGYFCENFIFVNSDWRHICHVENLSLEHEIGPRHGKTCLLRFANNKCADQPVHPPSLISAYVVHFLKSIISKLATCEIKKFISGRGSDISSATVVPLKSDSEVIYICYWRHVCQVDNSRLEYDI